MEENIGWIIQAPALRGRWLNNPSKEVTSDNSINAVIMEQANAINIVNEGKLKNFSRVVQRSGESNLVALVVGWEEQLLHFCFPSIGVGFLFCFL